MRLLFMFELQLQPSADIYEQTVAAAVLSDQLFVVVKILIERKKTARYWNNLLLRFLHAINIDSRQNQPSW